MTDTGVNLFEDVVDGDFGKTVFSTGVNVERQIVLLRPRMDRQMRFADDDHSADSVRWKLVKRDGPDLRVGPFCCFDEDFLKFVDLADSGVAS